MAAIRGDLESKCSLPMEVGLCSSRQARWHFNLTSSRCEPFNYTGCRGNDNRFETRSACIAECDPDRCEPVTCRMFCPFGWATDGEGCEICQCRNPCKVILFKETTPNGSPKLYKGFFWIVKKHDIFLNCKNMTFYSIAKTGPFSQLQKHYFFRNCKKHYIFLNGKNMTFPWYLVKTCSTQVSDADHKNKMSAVQWKDISGTWGLRNVRSCSVILSNMNQ